ncbi:ABC transporter ATP-binding protein [Lysinibacillus sphaericus]
MKFPVRKFLSYYRPYLPMFFFVLVCALLTSSLTLIFPLLVRYVTKDLLEGGASASLKEVLLVGSWMFLLVIIQNIGNYIVDYKGHEIGARMETDMRRELFSHMQKLSFRFFDKQHTGQLMTRITNDLLLVSELYHHGPEDYVKYLTRFIGAFIILFTINAPLTAAVFCFFPVLAFVSLHFNKSLNRSLTDNKQRIGDINAQVEDSLSGIRVVQSFGNEAMEIDKFHTQNLRFLKSRKGTYQAEAYFYNGTEALIQMITITVVIYGAVQILDASIGLPDLITFLLYIGFMVEPIQRLTHMSTQFQEGVTGFQRFMEIMNLNPEIENGAGAKEIERVNGHIEFKNVTFRYEQDQEPVLNQLSFVIHPGEYAAIVGSSGVGKTTLSALIPRFYDVDEGAIHIDGVNNKDLDLSFLRKSIGTVQQDVYLFQGTVMENIRYGRPDASDSEVVEAAKKANAHEFIMKMPGGYHSEIGQRGIRLSGGQKQRLSIARVFLKNPPILILDEATSALDNESESIVKNSLESLAKGRTTLVIAHRLSTIRNAGRILVLSRDGIVEEGDHQSLLGSGGHYSTLYSKQFEIG